MTERTKQVELNLEESGWLCYLLLPELLKLRGPPKQRAELLYGKLADANDYCMGKVSNAR